ncbi:acetyl-CoA carboxylase carboxyl transferase subunit beta [Thermosulfidibacter takaii ABI70S6]|uniref:Acetyl-coenzyme A carboxylase carboxyl transferase subunit beta n=1 Tax=Thermosulfidibacter takaii (strain DSM 17441 / JCM 13301 / NBRC 103674 / ABI70S6) TaxID=1298851 RepID=A0A0S3QV47_THET7|nr:acetyl-CoA carboxylase, carboxyltransferase subunit beta [Thermosulfidibacter takaii]BAT72191.1 acetyl-CoA carboxylase carboxyl transferase subunit beta [Thermosulfidibacter takaii ABI70S6]
MRWFKDTLSRVKKGKKVDQSLWVNCNGCNEIVYKKEVERNLKVCPKCGYHFRIGAWERINMLLDEGSVVEYDANLAPLDPLKFKDTKKYTDRLEEAQKKTGMKDAVVSVEGTISGIPVQFVAFEFGFLGGSMGSVVGEKITRAAERSIQKRQTLIIVSCSGGARMQESMLSLMQMAKTCAAVKKVSEAKVPFISILSDPTTGGVSASFALIADVVIAEPGALIGFAGPRVIEQTIGQKLPEGFQRAEYLLEHGFVDMIVERKRMKEVLSNLLTLFQGGCYVYSS